MYIVELLIISIPERQLFEYPRSLSLSLMSDLFSNFFEVGLNKNYFHEDIVLTYNSRFVLAKSRVTYLMWFSMFRSISNTFFKPELTIISLQKNKDFIAARVMFNFYPKVFSHHVAEVEFHLFMENNVLKKHNIQNLYLLKNPQLKL